MLKRVMLGILLGILGVGFGLFFSPVVIYGVFNIGNITGMLLFGGLFCAVLFRRRVGPAAVKLMRRTWVRAAASVLAVCVLAGGTFACVCGARIVKGAKNAPQPADEPMTVVVLGCRVYDSGPSLMLWSRINAAYAYLAAHPEAVAVLSGGQGPDEPVSEAEAMYDALTNMGIAPERLIKEDASTSTMENLTFSLDLIKEQELPERVALVTNEYHEYRASVMATMLGCTLCRAVSAPSQKILLPTYFVREIFGVAYLLLGG